MNMLILKLGDMLSFELQRQQLSKSGILAVVHCTLCRLVYDSDCTVFVKIISRVVRFYKGQCVKCLVDAFAQISILPWGGSSCHFSIYSGIRCIQG